jgi:hypothetical protein
MNRHLFIAVGAAGLALSSVADAAPAFGATSHRTGGAAAAEKRADRPLIEVVLSLIGFDFAATVEPVVGESAVRRDARAKECEQSKKTEVAKAEPKDEEGGGAAKRSRTGEPLYLAF